MLVDNRRWAGYQRQASQVDKRCNKYIQLVSSTERWVNRRVLQCLHSIPLKKQRFFKDRMGNAQRLSGVEPSDSSSRGFNAQA